jgi:hypothetical protein
MVQTTAVYMVSSVVGIALLAAPMHPCLIASPELCLLKGRANPKVIQEMLGLIRKANPDMGSRKSRTLNQPNTVTIFGQTNGCGATRWSTP